MKNASFCTSRIGPEDQNCTYQAASVSRHPALDSWAAARADTLDSESAKSSRASASRHLAACPARPLAASDRPNQAAMCANSAEPSHQQVVAHPRHNSDKARPSPDSDCPVRLLGAFCHLAAYA